jgi:Ca2+-binding EF-hand superfamily protein
MLARIKSLLTMGFFTVVSIMAVSSVDASSYKQGSDQKSGGHGKFDRPFSEMDTDGDESLSYTEFKQVFPSTEQQGFDRLDSDKDGGLSREEWHEFKSAHGLKHMD